MRKWITQHDVLTKLLSIVAAFILWSYFMGAQNPKRTLEYKDIAVQLTGVDQLYNNYNLKIIEGADATVDVKVSGSTNRLATLTASTVIHGHFAGERHDLREQNAGQHHCQGG